MELRFLGRYNDIVFHSTADVTEFDENQHKIAKRLAIAEGKDGGALIQRLIQPFATVPQPVIVAGERAGQLLGHRNRGLRALESSTRSEASSRLFASLSRREFFASPSNRYARRNADRCGLALKCDVARLVSSLCHMTAMLNSQPCAQSRSGATLGHL